MLAKGNSNDSSNGVVRLATTFLDAKVVALWRRQLVLLFANHHHGCRAHDGRCGSSSLRARTPH